MLLIDPRGAVVVSVMAVAVVACGRSDTPQARGESKAESEKLPETDAEAAPEYEFWVEASASADEVREYYAGFRAEGEAAVYSVLMVTQKGASQSMPYQLTETKTNAGKGITTRSTGNLTIEPIPGKTTPAYRLDGGASPSEAKVFVRVEDRLHQPKDPADLDSWIKDRAGPDSWREWKFLSYGVKAANGRVELSYGLFLPRPRVRLRAGDVLVIQLEDEWVKATGTSPPLRQEGSNKDGRWQLVTFRAVKSGSTDLEIGGREGRRGVVARVKVE